MALASRQIGLRGLSQRHQNLQSACSLSACSPVPVTKWHQHAAPLRKAPGRCTGAVTKASLTVADAVTGVRFPLAQKFWEGDTFRCLGAGNRAKRIVFVDVQVYAVGLYVEADKTAKELGIRSRGGFFETEQDYCDALLDGAFHKVLVIHLVRDVDGQQFTDALEKYLVPRLQLAGELNKLEEFKAAFAGKQLAKNTEVVLFWNTAGDLEVAVAPPSTSAHEFDRVKPEARIRSVALCRGLFEIFLGSGSVVASAKTQWVAGAKQLLDSEEVKRSTRRSGGG